MRTQGSRVVNALTIDVEDYFQVSAMAPYIDRSQWDAMPCRVENNVTRMLALLEQHGARATFFTLGWIAKRYPALVRSIVTSGHELASHGYSHRRANEQSREEFREDVTRSKLLLEDLGGVPVLGYRAPSFSIDESNPWAFDVLAEAGYRYSSSVYPVQHDHYGMPSASRFPFEARAGLIEVPITTVRLAGRNLPAGGGGFFRLNPYGLSRWVLNRVNRHEARPAIFYIHPWEIDPGQPRVAGISLKTRFRHYLNLGRTESRFARLLSDFRWDTLPRVFDLQVA